MVTKNTAMNIWRTAFFLCMPLSLLLSWTALPVYLIGVVIGFLGHAIDSRGSDRIKMSDVIRMLF